MGGVASNLGGLQQSGRIRRMREAPGAVVEANGGQEAAECYVQRDFVSGKGATLEIRQAWRGRRRQGHVRFRGKYRDRWVLGCWDRDR